MIFLAQHKSPRPIISARQNSLAEALKGAECDQDSDCQARA